MPGLFDKVKEGVLNVFGGVGPGAGSALMDAGAAAIMADTQDPLEALAAASVTGRQRQQQEANRAQIQGLINEAGVTPETLQQLFLTTLGQGDVESAKAISEVLKTLMASRQQETPVNTQMVDIPVSAVPIAFRERFAGHDTVQVPRNPRTNQYDWNAAVPKAPDAPVYERTFPGANPTTGAPGTWGIIRGTGEQVYLGDKPATEGVGGVGGGAEAQRRAILAAATNNALDIAFSAPEGLSGWTTGTLARWSEGRGILPDIARGVLEKISPETQVAQAGRQMLMSTLTPLLSGAAMTDRERMFYGTAFTIQTNDAPETIAAKYAAIRALMEAFEAGVLHEKTDAPDNAQREAENAAFMAQVYMNTIGQAGLMNVTSEAGAPQGPTGGVVPQGGGALGGNVPNLFPPRGGP